MGIKQIPLRKWIAFLKAQGLVKVRCAKGHDKWNHPTKPLMRPVTYSNHHKSISSLVIHTCLITLGISHTEFEQIIAAKKMVHVSELRKKINPIPAFLVVYRDQDGNKEVQRLQGYTKHSIIDQFYDEHNYNFTIIEIIKESE